MNNGMMAVTGCPVPERRLEFHEVGCIDYEAMVSRAMWCGAPTEDDVRTLLQQAADMTWWKVSEQYSSFAPRDTLRAVANTLLYDFENIKPSTSNHSYDQEEALDFLRGFMPEEALWL